MSKPVPCSRATILMFYRRMWQRSRPSPKNFYFFTTRSSHAQPPLLCKCHQPFPGQCPLSSLLKSEAASVDMHCSNRKKHHVQYTNTVILQPDTKLHLCGVPRLRGDPNTLQCLAFCREIKKSLCVCPNRALSLYSRYWIPSQWLFIFLALSFPHSHTFITSSPWLNSSLIPSSWLLYLVSHVLTHPLFPGSYTGLLFSQRYVTLMAG